jgi:hypothetical protein
MSAFLLSLLAFVLSLPVAAIERHYCEPAWQIRVEIGRAEAVFAIKPDGVRPEYCPVPFAG